MPPKKRSTDLAVPKQKAKAKTEPAKRRKKVADDTIEQLPPEQVAQYQEKWKSLGFSKPAEVKNTEMNDTDTKKDEKTASVMETMETIPADLHHAADSGQHAEETIVNDKTPQATNDNDKTETPCAEETMVNDKMQQDTNDSHQPQGEVDITVKTKDSLRDDLSEMVADALSPGNSSAADSFTLRPFLDAQKHPRFAVFAVFWKENHGREPFHNPDSCQQDLLDFQTWLIKDKQELVTYASIIQEALASEVWKDYVGFWTNENDNEHAMEAAYYENFEIDSPEVDLEMEVSQWVRFVQKFSKLDKLASGGPTIGFINNIKDAMPHHLRDPDALSNYRNEFPERDMCFTLLREVSADAKLFEMWMNDQESSRLNVNKENSVEVMNTEMKIDAMTVSKDTDTLKASMKSEDEEPCYPYGDLYVSPPSYKTHPDINDILESATDVLLKRAAHRLPDLRDRIRALPRQINVADLFTGTGCFNKVCMMLFQKIENTYPGECEDLEVVHKFMCENVGFKQKFLLAAYKDDSCLFSEATQLLTGERMCVRHNDICELPSELFVLGAGFSCKSYSKLHKDFPKFQSAMANDDEDASSVITFKSTKEMLESVDCRTFLLENVDMEESKSSSSDDSNLDLIVQQLEGIGGGYWLRVYKVLSRDFGLPQRRIRLFFLGVSKRHYPDFNMNAVTKHLEAFKLQSQTPADFLLHDECDAVRAEVERRQSRKAQAERSEGRKKKDKEKDKEKDKDNQIQGEPDNDETLEVEKSSKWKEQHMVLAESRSLRWPLEVPEDMSGNDWFQTLSDREKEVVLFMMKEKNSQQAAGGTNSILRFGDLYQSATRTPTSSETEIPTALPSTKLWDLVRNRLVLGRELLHLQGLQFPNAVLNQFSEPQLCDLAGNSFTSTIVLAILLACIIELPHVTDSEVEEESANTTALQTFKNLRR